MRTVGGEPATSVEEDEVVTNCNLDGGRLVGVGIVVEERRRRVGLGGVARRTGARRLTAWGLVVVVTGSQPHRSWARLGALGFIGQGERRLGAVVISRHGLTGDGASGHSGGRWPAARVCRGRENGERE